MSSKGCVPTIGGLPPDPPPEIFSDTSVFLARMKSKRMEQKVDSLLGGFRFRGTSTCVLLEFGRVFLKEMKYLGNLLKQELTVEEVLYHVNNRLPRRFHSDKTLWLFNLIARNFGHPEAEERVKCQIEEFLLLGKEAVSRRCDDVVDGGLDCQWAVQTDDWRVPRKCGESSVKCGIVEFFEANRTQFVRIAAACRHASRDETGQLHTFAGLIQDALAKPEILRDSKTCQRLGDAIISVQSQGYKAFFTQNFKDSRTLCSAMEQLLGELWQNPDEPVHWSDFRSPD